MSLPLGSSPLQWVTHFFGPRVLCKVSIKNGDSSHFDQKHGRKEKFLSSYFPPTLLQDLLQFSKDDFLVAKL